MKPTKHLLSCTLAAASLLAVPALADQSAAKILEFDTMAGVSAPYVGTANPVRGVPGGGRPWVLDGAHGELHTDGRLEIEVRGLVLAGDLTNPIPNFRAIVSCLGIDGTGAPTTINVGTDNFPASPAGDAKIEATVALPTPCFAPIVFVTSPGGAWFAVTGR